MTRNTATQIRKRPLQERSRATVETLLEATARVLVEDGYEATTTNRVARVAGVSIGSLYQYFPNKQALVRALLERHMAEAEASRPAELGDDSQISLRERMRVAVEWFLRLHAIDPALHQVLTTRVPHVFDESRVQHLERQLQVRIRFVLEQHRDEVRPRNLDVAAFLVAQSLESLTHGAVVHHPELLDHPDLADEMTELLVAYLGI